ncbi:hypothetical protein Tco_0239367, partial [Tanacetum coccineum]
MNLDDESDIEGVSDTVFDDKADSLGHEHTQNLSPNEKENSSDPFNLYNLLNKRDKDEANSGLDSSMEEDNILEKFKIIVRGKKFVIRAKELFVWSSTFNDNKEVDDYSEDDSVNGDEEIN